jgi:hypothetical protein
MVLKQGGAAIHSSPDEEKNTKDEHEAVPQAIPIHPHDKEEEEDDDDECCFLAFVLTIKTWFASFDSQDYFEAQKPGYTTRPCTDSLPQKPSENNPRHRSQFYRNR